jgi:hypothetical protein
MLLIKYNKIILMQKYRNRKNQGLSAFLENNQSYVIKKTMKVMFEKRIRKQGFEKR